MNYKIFLTLFFLNSLAFSLSKKEYRDLEVFAKVLDIIGRDYVDEIDHREIIYSAIRGIISQLDPHSQHYPPDSYKAMKQDTSGTFGGLGIEITTKNNQLLVVSPIEGSPAHAAGVKPKDIIVKIDNISTDKLTMYECVKKLKGKIGTDITIHVKREGEKDLISFTIKRKKIREHSVAFNDFGSGLLYVRISQFQERTASEFKKDFYKYLKKNKKINGLIIDMRLNPGGILNQAVEVANIFLDKGVIVSMAMRQASEKTVFEATATEAFKDFPIAVLVDDGSASASEILAAALQEHKRAVVVGIKTFGKGTVQNVIDLPDGSGLKLTIAKYFTPSGKSIQGLGIKPDIKVAPLNAEELKKVKDLSDKELLKYFRKKKVLKGNGRLDNLNLNKILATDVQLRKALDYINSKRK